MSSYVGQEGCELHQHGDCIDVQGRTIVRIDTVYETHPEVKTYYALLSAEPTGSDPEYGEFYDHERVFRTLADAIDWLACSNNTGDECKVT